MALHQSWVHGTAFAPPEEPASGLYRVDNIWGTDIVGLRRGWGIFFLGQPGTANWFHVSIPTPTIIEGARVRLQRVFVLFSAGISTATSAGQSGANITDIHASTTCPTRTSSACARAGAPVGWATRGARTGSTFRSRPRWSSTMPQRA